MSRSLLHSLFLDHPASVEESYFEHLGFAARFSFWLIVAGLAAAVHALIPALCKTTASRIVTRLHDRMQNRGADRHASQNAEIA